MSTLHMQTEERGTKQFRRDAFGMLDALGISTCLFSPYVNYINYYTLLQAKALANPELFRYHLNVSGGSSGAGPPVPISNTEVKHPSADDTALATGWENRSLPEA